METGGRKGGKNLPPVSLYVDFAILSKPNFSKPSPFPCKVSWNFTVLYNDTWTACNKKTLNLHRFALEYTFMLVFIKTKNPFSSEAAHSLSNISKKS